MRVHIRPVVLCHAHAIKQFDPIKVDSCRREVKHLCMADHQHATCRRIAARLRSNGRSPPFQAFLATLAFPAEVCGPVELSHGRHLRIAIDC